MTKYAFPQLKAWDSESESYQDFDTSSGMELRDYFAAAALTGYRAAALHWSLSVGGKFLDPSQIAEWSYADADAMLAERDK
jgi:hypothetical protein